MDIFWTESDGTLNQPHTVHHLFVLIYDNKQVIVQQLRLLFAETLATQPGGRLPERLAFGTIVEGGRIQDQGAGINTDWGV